MTRKSYLQLNGDDWLKARMQALVRDNFCCQAHQLGISNTPCSETRLKELQVHHLKMRVHGGNHDLANLITICKVHHEMLHPWMKNSLPQEQFILPKSSSEL